MHLENARRSLAAGCRFAPRALEGTFDDRLDSSGIIACMIEMKGFRVTGPWESAGPYHPQLGGVPVPESKRPENEPGQPPSVRAQFLWAGRTEGKAGSLVPSLEHEAHGVGRQRPGGKLLLLPEG